MSNDFRGEVLAEIVRNGLVESIHTGHLVMLNAAGSIFKSKGSIEMPIFPRSSVKSLQASAMLRAGLKVDDRQLALTQASHSGSQMHQDAVLEILHGVGLSESDLQNAPFKPFGELERMRWGEKPGASIASDCSGKHAGMLATCITNGWDTKTYLDPEHPMQVAILSEIESLIGGPVSNKTFDGCGAPLFAMPTIDLARAIQKMTLSTDPIYQRVLESARDYPEMLGGEGRLVTRLIQSVPGLFMKDGAEAVCVLSLKDGRTLVFKVADGALRPFGIIIQEALKQWGIMIPEEHFNVYGGSNLVGGMRAAF
jgi:L-asparaginase II